MLQITPQQVGNLSDARQARFEADMLLHLRGFLPNVAASAGDDRLAAAIHAGAQRAHLHGFTQRGPVRLYLEMMTLLGSHFDTDPQYHWAAQVLQQAGDETSERQRAQELHHRFSRYLELVGGPDDPPAAGARQRARDLGQRAELAGEPAVGKLVQLATYAYPEKAGVVGNAGLSLLAQAAIGQSERHGLVSPRQVALVFGLMLAFGHGCLDDPLHPWIKQALVSSAAGTSPGVGPARLEEAALMRLEEPRGHTASAKEA